MALQVFTAGQTLTATQMNTLQASAYNYTLSTVSTSTYTVVSSDAGKLLIFTNNSDPVEVTFPSSLAIDVGDTVEIVYAGTGSLDFIADTGVTLNSEGSLLSLGSRYARVSVTKTASDVFLVSWMTAITEPEIATGSITSDKISPSGIADTKLATISTAGKVSNSATTATASSGNNTIVARDSSGNFSAGTITANLTGTATNASKISNRTVFVQNATPTALAVGDIWFQVAGL